MTLKKLSQIMKLRKKHLGKRKVVIETASKLYKVLNIYATLYDKLSEDSKKRVDVLKILIPLLEIEDLNALIDNKPSFDQPVKSKQETYEKLTKMSGNDDYTTGNLLDYLCHQKYKLVIID